MKTNNGLLIKRVMPTLLGMALFGGLSALPALAQSDQNTDIKANELTPPVPQTDQPTPQTDETAPKVITGYIFDFPVAVLDFPLDNAIFSSLSEEKDVVLWPSQESIDNGTGYIYLLRGNTLYQENVNTLDVINETTVPSLADNDIGASTDNSSRRMRMHRQMRMHRNYDVQTTMTDMGLLPAANITANGGYLYMVRGNTLYKFDAQGLNLVRQTELPGQAESIKSNNTTPDETPYDIDEDRLDETHPDNINPGKGTDDNGTNDNSTNDESR